MDWPMRRGQRPTSFPDLLGTRSVQYPSQVTTEFSQLLQLFFRCIQRCSEKDNGYAYAGVQNIRECFCSNDPPPVETLVDDSECDSKCSGDQDQICGAQWRMNVYSTSEL